MAENYYSFSKLNGPKLLFIFKILHYSYFSFLDIFGRNLTFLMEAIFFSHTCKIVQGPTLVFWAQVEPDKS